MVDGKPVALVKSLRLMTDQVILDGRDLEDKKGRDNQKEYGRHGVG